MTTSGLAACMIVGQRGVGGILGMISNLARRPVAAGAYAELRRLLRETPAAKAPAEPSEAGRGSPVGLTAEVDGTRLTVAPGEIVVVTAASRDVEARLFRAMVEAAIYGESPGRASAGKGLVRIDRAEKGGVVAVPPMPPVLIGTVMENMTNFDPRRSEEALRLADALGVQQALARLPDGYQTKLGVDFGLPLSDGVVKRIGLVRGLSAMPRLIVLGWPTAALDKDGEDRLVRVEGTVRADDHRRVRPGGVAAGHRLPCRRLRGSQGLGEGDRGMNFVGRTAPAASYAGHEVSAMPGAPGGRQPTPVETLLPEILFELDWRRSPEILEGAYAEDHGIETLDEAALALGLIGITATVSDRVPGAWDDGLDGALITLSRGKAHAVVRSHGRTNGCGGESERDAMKRIASASRVMHVRVLPQEQADTALVQSIRRRIRRNVRYSLFLSFLINLVAIAIPLFSKAIYDRVLGANAAGSLIPLVSGAAIVVAIVFVLRRLRSRFLAAEYARLGATLACAVENRLQRVPPQTAQRFPRNGVETRIRNTVRAADLFASNNTSALFDAPFVPLSILAIAFVGGLMALVPALYLAIFVAIGWLIARQPSGLEPELARASGERVALLGEPGDRAADIHESGGGGAWLRRFAEVSQQSAHAAYHVGVRSDAAQAIAYVLGTGRLLRRWRSASVSRSKVSSPPAR